MKLISKFNAFLSKYEKISALLFFALGFAWDWFTVGRIDNISEIAFLVGYFILLSLSIFLSFTYFTFSGLQKYNAYLGKYLPIATQFFLGGLTSTFVIFISRSVSFSRTAVFLFLLVFFFITNEFFSKKVSFRIQFVHFSIVSFMFFGCITPLIFSELDAHVFYIAAAISLAFTFFINTLIFLRVENKDKMKFLKLKIFIGLAHLAIVIFFILKLIPPVPLALKNGFVAYHVKKIDNIYEVTYKPRTWFQIWNTHENELKFRPHDSVFVFTSIFSPNDIKKKVFHEWFHYDDQTEDWELTDKIGYTIQGGRNNGFRGYTYKTHLVEGEWKVEVVTEEELIIGVLNFKINLHDGERPKKLKTKYF